MANASKGFGSTSGSCRGDNPQCDRGSSRGAASSRSARPRNARDPRQANGTLDAIALPDAHCHVAFMEQPTAFAAQANAGRAAILSVTVTPEEFHEMGCGHAAGPSHESVRTALGLHPWWVPESEKDLTALLMEFDAQLPNAPLIGEVGLDFSKRREHTRTQQLQAFRHIADAAAACSAQALSLHCVNAYPEALRILEESGCAERCRCIFHWFSGSSQQLDRAVKLGCWFSVSERMLQTKRGRAYAKAIPLGRLLLETDAPTAQQPEVHHPAVAYTFEEHQANLKRTLLLLASLRGSHPKDIAIVIRGNIQSILG